MELVDLEEIRKTLQVKFDETTSTILCYTNNELHKTQISQRNLKIFFNKDDSESDSEPDQDEENDDNTSQSSVHEPLDESEIDDAESFKSMDDDMQDNREYKQVQPTSDLSGSENLDWEEAVKDFEQVVDFEETEQRQFAKAMEKLEKAE